MGWYAVSMLTTLTESVLGLHHALARCDERSLWSNAWEDNAAAWARLAAHAIHQIEAKGIN